MAYQQMDSLGRLVTEGTSIFRTVEFHRYRKPYVVEYPQNAIVLNPEHTAKQRALLSAAAGQTSSDEAVQQDLFIYDDDDDPRRPIPEALTQPSFLAESVLLRWKVIKPQGRGLINMGNTCFLNSVLQALAHVPPLQQYLTQHITTPVNIAGAPQDFAFHLAETMRHLEDMKNVGPGGRILPVKPSFIVANLRVLSKSYRPGHQACSHEFTQHLLDACQTALLYRLQRGQRKLPYNVTFTSPLFRIVGGQLRSQVAWAKSDEIAMLRKANNVSAARELQLDKSVKGDELTSNTYDPFSVLNVPLAGSSLRLCLDSFFEKETLEGRIYQSPRKVGVRATKCFRLHVLPAMLTIHIKRFTARGQKINKNISFPMELDVSNYCSGPPQGPRDAQYTLSAVIVHIGGSATSGHYVCYAKGRADTWLYCDDERVASTKLDTVKGVQAYMLFYTKVTGQSLVPRMRKLGVAAPEVGEEKKTTQDEQQTQQLTRLSKSGSAKGTSSLPVAGCGIEDLGLELDARAVQKEISARGSKDVGSDPTSVARSSQGSPRLSHDRAALTSQQTRTATATMSTRVVFSNESDDDSSSSERAPAEEQHSPALLASSSAAAPSPAAGRSPRLLAQPFSSTVIPFSYRRGSSRDSQASVPAAASSGKKKKKWTFDSDMRTENEAEVEVLVAEDAQSRPHERQDVVATGQQALNLLQSAMQEEENHKTVRRPRHFDRFRVRMRDEQYEKEMDKGRVKKVRRKEMNFADASNPVGPYSEGANPFQLASNKKIK